MSRKYGHKKPDAPGHDRGGPGTRALRKRHEREVARTKREQERLPETGPVAMSRTRPARKT